MPHSDGAGIIVDVGKNVDSNRIGEEFGFGMLHTVDQMEHVLN